MESEEKNHSRCYPRLPEGIPDWEERRGAYHASFARSNSDLDDILRLRYQVFNLELGEGLERSHMRGLDEDEFDAHCHHIVVRDLRDQSVVGTYRMLTAELAAFGSGFYSAREFCLEHLPDSLLATGLELGRACIAKKCRKGVVLHLLFRGIAAYLIDQKKNFLFGCGSLPTLDPVTAQRSLECFESEGVVHPELWVEPTPAYAKAPASTSGTFDSQERPPIPELFEIYFSLGAQVASSPAFDHEFGTTDYLLLFDFTSVEPALLRKYTD